MNSDVNTNPTFTTAQGDPVILSRSSFLIKSIRKFLSILDSSGEFVGLKNEGSRTLRYDWVEKLDAKDSILVSATHKPSSILDNTNNDVVDVMIKQSTSTTKIRFHASLQRTRIANYTMGIR